MKTAGKVALVGLGLAAIAAVPFLAMGGGIIFDRAEKPSPEDEKRWQDLRARGLPIPAVMRAPDGSLVRLSPNGTVLGPVVSGNPRGHYG